MTLPYGVLPSADRDLDEQAGYLMQAANLETSLRFYDAAAATCDKLARTPGIGERRESADPRLEGLRVSPIEGFRNHLMSTARSRVGSKS
jgi:toxin ParE1/3/4